VLYLDKLLGETENEGEGHNEIAIDQRLVDLNTVVALSLPDAGQHGLRREVSQLQTQVDMIGVSQSIFHETVNKHVNQLACQPGRQFRNQGQKQ
jgi:hypothetical protein